MGKTQVQSQYNAFVMIFLGFVKQNRFFQICVNDCRLEVYLLRVILLMRLIDIFDAMSGVYKLMHFVPTQLMTKHWQIYRWNYSAIDSVLVISFVLQTKLGSNQPT